MKRETKITNVGQDNNKKKKVSGWFRFLMYGIGILSLALGLTLNTKTQLGTSPIISVPYTISCIWQLNFGNLTLIYYTLFVIAQFIIKGKNRQLMDVLQIPFSIVFTRFLNLFDAMFQLEVHNLWQKLLILAAAILFTGIGVVLTVNMKLIVNPGDGIVQAIAGRIKKSMGLTKNIVDFTCLIISCLMGFVFAGRFTVGIGLGTVIAMICVGRVIAVLNFFFKKKMQEKAGLVFTEI